MTHGGLRLSLVLSCIAAAFVCFAGCQRSSAFTVRVEGMKVPREYAPRLEVTNWNGNIQIIANERFTQPEVRAQVRAQNESAPSFFDELRKTVTVRAVSLEESGARVLRVTAAPAGFDSPAVACDLQIKVPKISGVVVTNSGGGVEVVGISGSVAIHNGGPGKVGGDVEIRTGKAMTQDVSVITSEGRVHYQVGPGSTGKIEINSTEGMPFVDAKIGSLDSINYQGDKWRGSLGNGRNIVSLRTHKGDARMLVLENAGQYRELWDGWPEWPKNPKWLAKLAGE
jgi:hypothetical protein